MLDFNVKLFISRVAKVIRNAYDDSVKVTYGCEISENYELWNRMIELENDCIDYLKNNDFNKLHIFNLNLADSFYNEIDDIICISRDSFDEIKLKVDCNFIKNLALKTTCISYSKIDNIRITKVTNNMILGLVDMIFDDEPCTYKFAFTEVDYTIF